MDEGTRSLDLLEAGIGIFGLTLQQGRPLIKEAATSRVATRAYGLLNYAFRHKAVRGILARARAGPDNSPAAPCTRPRPLVVQEIVSAA